MFSKLLRLKNIIKEYIVISLIIFLISIVFKVFNLGFEYITYSNDFALNGVISLIVGLIKLIPKVLYISIIIELIVLISKVCIKGFSTLVKIEK